MQALGIPYLLGYPEVNILSLVQVSAFEALVLVNGIPVRST